MNKVIEGKESQCCGVEVIEDDRNIIMCNECRNRLKVWN